MLKKGVENNDSELLVNAFRSLYSILKLMGFDMQNHWAQIPHYSTYHPRVSSILDPSVDIPDSRIDILIDSINGHSINSEFFDIIDQTPDVSFSRANRKFLEETQCLTKLRHRIQKKHVSVLKYVRVNLLGEGKRWLWGHLNDNLVAALPDTGSDAMIISWDYAWRLGLRVDSNPEDIVKVEFADGTTALTGGMVRGALWSSGDHSIRCDFLVLDNLLVDIVLAKDYLFDLDVFSNCTAHFTEDEDIEHLDVCGIRLVREFGERFGNMLGQLEDDSIEDMISQDAFSPVMVNREWTRRDRIRDEIEALGDNKRAEAEAAETRRQEQWERARADHRQR
ncbi:hypothetical protein F4801DRAFT_604968 [Xylaria longipes]|nr:hypothetical protein F4801DRAFT_604968 [Xylaria longipes]